MSKYSTYIEDLLNEAGCDDRVIDGTINLELESHLEALTEVLSKRWKDELLAVDFINSINEGRFPDRQAYNRDGLLVTFPTPEYKKRAIERGTHFEENPAKKQSNLFPNAQPAQNVQTSAPVEPTATPDVALKAPEPTPAPSTSEPAAPAPVQAPKAPEPKPTPTPPAPAPDPAQLAQDEKNKAIERQAEVQDVEKILTTECTVDDARRLKWKQDLKGRWYDYNGEIKGVSFYCDITNTNKISILR